MSATFLLSLGFFFSFANSHFVPGVFGEGTHSQLGSRSSVVKRVIDHTTVAGLHSHCHWGCTDARIEKITGSIEDAKLLAAVASNALDVEGVENSYAFTPWLGSVCIGSQLI
jgi:hypothetical protein